VDSELGNVTVGLVRSLGLSDRINILRESVDGLRSIVMEVAPDVTVTEVLLEERVAGSTSVIKQYVTSPAILAEIASLARDASVDKSRSHASALVF